jgi:hypothetical protein
VRRLLRFLWSIAASASLLAFATNARAANDPRLAWKTIETAHFRVNYYSTEDEVARRVAELAETIHARLSPALNWEPTEKVEIALTDQTDSANGLTSIIPYNEIELFLTAPDDLSPLGDVDDWYLGLLTHEYTHTLHIDQIRGLPALYNRIVGKAAAPNQVQPRWFIEGLAVYMESSRTSAGRLRSSTWNMFMRADVLEDNVAPLDVFSNTPRRWPQGNIYYLYGSFFLKYLAETYGEGAIRRIIDDYGRQVVPFAVNRSVRRATGRTYEQMYPAWIGSLRRQYQAQAAAIRAKGVREGRRLTFRGGTAEHPSWVPSNAFSDYARELVYFRDDQHTTAGLYGVHVERDARGGARPVDGSSELLVRTNDVSTPAFAPDGSLVFESVDITRRIFSFSDLHRLPPGVTSPSGLEGRRERLTNGFRARAPAVSPDGRRVVFSTQTRGTATMQIADFGPEGISHVRPLVPSARFEEVFAAAWSPDNRHVAYSVWKRGGYRDIRYVDADAGTYVDVTQDRAVDSGPDFTPDGRWLLFHSDRTRVSNVYAWEIATGRLKQVTNVVNGAFQPAVSPDGKTLAYVGYTHGGFDLFAMPFDPDSCPDADPFVDDRPPVLPEPEPLVLHPEPYNPLWTLRPRHYAISMAPGNFGERVSASVAGSDVAGHHSFSASLFTDLERPIPQFDVSYGYGRLPFDVSLHVFRSVTPRGGFGIGTGEDKQIWLQDSIGADTGVSFPMPSAFDGQTLGMSYSASRISGELPVPVSQYDPYQPVTVPVRGTLGALNLGWSYSNAQRYLWSLTAEKGFSTSANVSLTDPWLGSSFSGFAASTDIGVYLTMPWLQHHTVTLHGNVGTSAGNFPGRGPFFVGGFVDYPVVDTVRNILIQGGVVLRGYEPVTLVGRNVALFNGEYHFPIANIDRGLSTLPLFFQRVSGTVFFDYGSAFNAPETAKFKSGVGGELWFDSTLAYVVGFTFRLGYARGLASQGIDKVYFVAAVPY